MRTEHWTITGQPARPSVSPPPSPGTETVVALLTGAFIGADTMTLAEKLVLHRSIFAHVPVADIEWAATALKGYPKKVLRLISSALGNRNRLGHLGDDPGESIEALRYLIEAAPVFGWFRDGIESSGKNAARHLFLFAGTLAEVSRRNGATFGHEAVRGAAVDYLVTGSGWQHGDRKLRWEWLGVHAKALGKVSPVLMQRGSSDTALCKELLSATPALTDGVL